jgi:hypothetical protein
MRSRVWVGWPNLFLDGLVFQLNIGNIRRLEFSSKSHLKSKFNGIMTNSLGMTNRKKINFSSQN